MYVAKNCSHWKAVCVVAQKTVTISWEGSLKICGSKHKSPKLVNSLIHHIIHALAFTQHWHRPQYSIYYSKSINFHALHYGSSELTLQTMRACTLTCTHPQSLMMMALLVSSTTQLMETSLLSCLQFTGIWGASCFISSQVHIEERRENPTDSVLGFFFAPQLCLLEITNYWTLFARNHRRLCNGSCAKQLYLH